MNADGSRGVTAQLQLGARTALLWWLGGSLGCPTGRRSCWLALPQDTRVERTAPLSRGKPPPRLPPRTCSHDIHVDDLRWAAQPVFTARAALRDASAFEIWRRVVRGCVKSSKPADALFERARIRGLATLDRSQRSGHLARVIGEVAESVA